MAFILWNEKSLWVRPDIPPRMSFLAVGIWWLGFSMIPFRVLKDKRSDKNASHRLADGYKELKKVFVEVKKQPIPWRFLLSFFFFNTGVLTVMYMATYFATDELHMKTPELITTILIIQLVAILGAWIFAKLSDKKGNFLSLMIILLIWIGICISAYYVQTARQFYMLAFVVGMVMGGVQSLSRSTYSKLLRNIEDTTSYFSFYDVCEKLGVVIGTAVFGVVSEWLGGLRASALSLTLFFLLGLIFLFWIIKKNKSYEIIYY